MRLMTALRDLYRNEPYGSEKIFASKRRDLGK